MSQFDNPQYFTNRELSWLAFNDRVLEEARDVHNPLLERVRFLGITQSNLDEFFNVRVASLRKMVTVGYTEPDAAGLTPTAQLHAIATERTPWSTSNTRLGAGRFRHAWWSTAFACCTQRSSPPSKAASSIAIFTRSCTRC